MPRSRSRFVAIAAAILLAAALLAGCGGSDGPSLGAKVDPRGATSTTVLPASSSLIAQPYGNEITVYQQPDTKSASEQYPNPWQLDDNPEHVVPQVFLVESEHDSWTEILLPVRPNGTTGWVRTQDVRLTPNPYSIDVSLAGHQITVHDGEQVLLQEPVAIGAEATPTPPGKYFLRVLLKAPDPNTVYGPYAYGLSAHSDVLDTFNGGDGEIGIHGNNDASVLGQSITHGCIRISNDSITRLASILPLGTPVTIAA
jgi:lipoprotein-anchoring transpeptidase ErfK/SrfK